jgi:hypothetical protein
MEKYRSQQERPAACVIAQQYSSTTSLSQGFHSRKRKFYKHFKGVIISVFLLF